MKKLPFGIQLDRVDVLKALSRATESFGELKGAMHLLPDPYILLNAIILGEAKDSSEIENIITTYDELYKEMNSEKITNQAAKEVLRYRSAMKLGFEDLVKNGYITTNSMVRIQAVIENNAGGIRKLPGTVIKNTRTGEVLHTPPQAEAEIRDLLSNLELYINQDLDDYDPLIKMALIHYQFESIHPFYDGNGRTGRILNVLYLVLKEKIDLPILYLSRYIIRNKETYYHLLKVVREDENKIVDFVIYLLKGIEETAQFTTLFIKEIVSSMDLTSTLMKERLPKIYSKELVEFLYRDFYTKVEFVQKNFGISRPTATKILKSLEKEGFLISERVGKENIYKNTALFNLINHW